MKILAQYTVVLEDDGSIRIYDRLKINVPVEISRPIADYFSKRINKKSTK